MMELVPWLIALASAACFGLIAFRAGRNWVSLAVPGGLFGLIACTCVFGLAQAASIPFSDRQRATQHVLWTIIAAVLVALVAGAFTLVLRRKSPSGPVSSNELASTAPRPQDKSGQNA